MSRTAGEGTTPHRPSVAIREERPDSPDAVALVAELEAELAALYPAASRHGFSVERLLAEAVVFHILRADGLAAGCGGVLFVDDYAELKRMFVRPAYRGLGHGSLILDHLAALARARGVELLRLEAGVRSTDALRLYERHGFVRIPPFGPYSVDPLTLCLEKRLR